MKETILAKWPLEQETRLTLKWQLLVRPFELNGKFNGILTGTSVENYM